MGEDEDGDPITYALVDELEGVAAKPKQKLSPSERAAVEVLNHLRDISGTERDRVNEADWRTACIDGRAVSASEDRDNRKRVFNRALASLIRRRIVDVRDGFALLMTSDDRPSDGDAFDLEDDA